MKIKKVNDTSDNFHKEMPVFDLPFKILINGKSQLSGKTTIILNLLLLEDYGYDKVFKGKNIYIVSDNKLDNKLSMLADYKEIPEENIMSYDENQLLELYDEIEEKFIEEKADNDIQYRLIIFEDVGYSGSMKNKQFGITSKMISNGRHLNLSQIYTSQRFSMVNTTIRSNITGAILFGSSTRERELINEDLNYLENKKDFTKMFIKATEKPRDFLCINFTGKDGLYYDSEFEPINTNPSKDNEPTNN